MRHQIPHWRKRNGKRYLAGRAPRFIPVIRVVKIAYSDAIGPLTEQQVKEMFLKEARHVWNNNSMINRISLEVVFDDVKSMALSTFGHPKAIGNSWYQAAREYRLHIGKQAFTYDRERFIKTLRHEAIHLGIMKHNDQFFEIARAKGATLTGSHEIGLGYRVEVQDAKGGRFKLVKSFDNEADAVKFQRELHEQYRQGKLMLRASRLRF